MFNYYTSISRKAFQPLIERYLESLEPDELVRINNAVCEHCNDMSSWWYSMDELDDCLFACSPTEVISKAIDSRHFNLNDEYFCWSDNDTLISTDYPETEIETADIAYNLLTVADAVSVLDEITDKELINLVSIADGALGVELSLYYKDE